MEHYAHQNYYNSLAVTESASFSNNVSVNKKTKILKLKRAHFRGMSPFTESIIYGSETNLFALWLYTGQPALADTSS